jgi:hypothetical protein
MYNLFTFAVHLVGPVAEWLGKALQKLLHQFESGRDLKMCILMFFNVQQTHQNPCKCRGFGLLVLFVVSLCLHKTHYQDTTKK